MSDSVLSSIILDGKILTKKELSEAQDTAQKSNISLYNALTSNDAIDKETLNKKIAASYKINYIDLSKVSIEKELLEMIPEVVAKKNLAVVFAHDKNGIHLAVNDPDNTKFISNFSKRIGDDVVLYFADEDSIKNMLTRATPEDSDLKKLLSSLKNAEKTEKAEDIPIIEIVNKILGMSFKNKSSDVHIEPHELKTLVRFRIDGILHDIVELPSALHDLLVTRLKIMARLRTDEHRAAQDGKLKFIVDEEKVDVRVSIIPIIWGEKVVMRLLSEKVTQYDLETLGFRPTDLEKIQRQISTPWGMILATGPTGCGKTTTLYSILKKLNTREVNISTIEDPVEYDIEGINQIQVNPKTNLTFSAGLRSLVRQDPDIILVGEIRDEETAKIAMNSAMTGHLVLSTLHTNDAATSLPRLTDMGVQPFLVASTINIIIAQRLVRKICATCKYQVGLNAKHIQLITKQISRELIEKFSLNKKDQKLFYGKGCNDCKNTGYKGRVGIFEIMEMTEELREQVMAKVNAAVLKKKAMEQGMITMLEDGIAKTMEGSTTLDEILRVTKE